MKAITNRWRTLVAVLVAGLTLFFVMTKIAAGHPTSPEPRGAAAAPASQPAQEPPPSNEIRDFPQLG